MQHLQVKIFIAQAITFHWSGLMFQGFAQYALWQAQVTGGCI